MPLTSLNKIVSLSSLVLAVPVWEILALSKTLRVFYNPEKPLSKQWLPAVDKTSIPISANPYASSSGELNWG